MNTYFSITTQKVKFYPTILYVLFMTLPISCSPDKPLLTGGPHYFKSFAGYNIPFKPIEPINEGEAKSLKAYYVALYNDNGQITEFAKYLDGELIVKDIYTYDDKGKLHKRVLTNLSSKKEIIGYFDEKGNLREQSE